MPCHETRDELLTESRVRETGGPQFHLDAHEPGGKILLIKGTCLSPLRRKVAWRSVHLRLPLKQAAVSLVKHSNNELIFASKVVMDQRMVESSFGCDITNVQSCVSFTSQATVVRLENSCSRL